MFGPVHSWPFRLATYGPPPAEHAIGQWTIASSWPGSTPPLRIMRIDDAQRQVLLRCVDESALSLNGRNSLLYEVSHCWAIVGVVILIAIVGAIVFSAIANARARRSLAAANAELSYLRPENARLQQWIAGFAGTPMNPEPPSGYGAPPSMPAQWYPDPSGRHELRHWNGTTWTDEVSDKGVTSTDPTN